MTPLLGTKGAPDRPRRGLAHVEDLESLPNLGFPPHTDRSRSSTLHGAPSPSTDVYLHVCQLVDTATAMVALLGLFVIDNLGRIPAGLDDFLGARLSVKNVMLLVGFAACWYLCCRWAGLYDWSRVHRRPCEMRRVCAAAFGGTLVAVMFPISSVSGAFRLEVLLPFFALGVVSILVARALLRTMLVLGAPGVRHIVIVGTGPRGQELSTQLAAEGTVSPAVVRFVDSSVSADMAKMSHASLDDLEEMLMQDSVDEVLIALPVKSCYADIQRTIQICERVGVPVKYPADPFGRTRLAPRVERSSTGPIVLVPVAAEGTRLALKRAIDLLGAGLALVLLSPVFLCVGLAVKLTSPGPMFFAQVRYGRGRRRFRMYKFRTMVDGAEALQAELESLNEQKAGPTFKIRQDPRLTRLGALLRRSSLDELPQLWNVLRGDMSLVGPRPMSLRDVELFSEAWLMRRFSVFPGITGLWQVSGRSDLPFEEWIRLDLAYIDHWSLTLDLKILLRTIPAVLSGTGAA